VSTTNEIIDLVDEVDYHCCISCDNIFPTEYELSIHVSDVHQDIVDSKLDRYETMDIQSTFVDDDFIQCDEYLEVFHNKSPPIKVKYNLYIILIVIYLIRNLESSVLLKDEF